MKEIEELKERLTKICELAGDGKYLFNVSDVAVLLKLLEDQNRNIQTQHLRLLDIQQLSHFPVCHQGTTPRVMNLIFKDINNRCAD
ncbi:MAG: hypothetical protein H7282_04855 [Cytophagaceae bacterium]|nr:hypothetical protein [Cytophagaceae bacterium]